MHIVTPMILLVVSGCAHPTVPPARPAIDPVAHGIHLVGFRADGAGYLVVERIVGISERSTRLMLYRVDSQTGDRIRIGRLDPDVERLLTRAWPGDRGLIPTLRPSHTGEQIELLGYEWPIRSEGTVLETEYGVLMLEDHRVVLRHETDTVTVAKLAPGFEISQSAWIVSRDGSTVGLTVAYGGHPEVVDLRVIHLAEAAARILSQRGYRAHVDHHYHRATVSWRQALALDPSAPEVSYNLACAEALLGRPESALEHLRRADDRLCRGAVDCRSGTRRDLLRHQFNPGHRDRSAPADHDNESSGDPGRHQRVSRLDLLCRRVSTLAELLARTRDVCVMRTALHTRPPWVV